MTPWPRSSGVGIAVAETARVADEKPATPRRHRINRGEALWGYALIAPTGLGLLVFYLWPVLQTGYLSFTHSGPFGGPAQWTGLANYRELLHDPEVARALRNTVAYTILG